MNTAIIFLTGTAFGVFLVFIALVCLLRYTDNETEEEEFERQQREWDRERDEFWQQDELENNIVDPNTQQYKNGYYDGDDCGGGCSCESYIERSDSK